MKLDVLVFGAHPDDVEMSCGGTLAKMVKAGKKVGIIDLTKGDMGTRGTPEIRVAEGESAAEILGVSVRENLGFRDCFFTEDEAHIKEIARVIRKYQPEIVIANAYHDKHPDHGRGSKLVRNAAHMSGSIKLETYEQGQLQTRWRPKRVFFYIQDMELKPDFIVDITEFFEIKIESIRAHKSQFFDPESTEPETYISTPAFWDSFEYRMKTMGHIVGVKYAEGFTSEITPKINLITDLL